LAEEMVIKRYVAQIFNMGAKADSLSESKRPGDYPTTFPGINAFIRGYLNKVIRYAERNRKLDKREKKNKESITEEAFERDLELEALVPVLERKIPVVFITHNMVTIQNALRIIKEYNLKGILYATADILQFVDQLAAEKIPVIWAGTTTMPQRGEPFDLNYRAASVLADKGILFAIVPSGIEVNASFNVRNLPEPASLSVAHGLAEEEAIKAITINPAKILGIDEMVGSLEVGKIADIVIWSDSPIQMTSRVHKVIINGKIIPLTSIQTQLRDKFEKIVRERMKEKKKQ
jgi:imidazolonepropionase-like amidohydrolase